MLKTICDHKTDIFPLKLKLWTEKKKPNCITVYWVCFSWFQCPILASILFIQSYQYSKHHGLPQEKVGMNMWSQKKPKCFQVWWKKETCHSSSPPKSCFLICIKLTIAQLCCAACPTHSKTLTVASSNARCLRLRASLSPNITAGVNTKLRFYGKTIHSILTWLFMWHFNNLVTGKIRVSACMYMCCIPWSDVADDSYGCVFAVCWVSTRNTRSFWMISVQRSVEQRTGERNNTDNNVYSISVSGFMYFLTQC